MQSLRPGPSEPAASSPSSPATARAGQISTEPPHCKQPQPLTLRGRGVTGLGTDGRGLDGGKAGGKERRPPELNFSRKWALREHACPLCPWHDATPPAPLGTQGPQATLRIAARVPGPQGLQGRKSPWRGYRKAGNFTPQRLPGLSGPSRSSGARGSPSCELRAQGLPAAQHQQGLDAVTPPAHLPGKVPCSLISECSSSNPAALGKQR